MRATTSYITATRRNNSNFWRLQDSYIYSRWNCFAVTCAGNPAGPTSGSRLFSGGRVVEVGEQPDQLIKEVLEEVEQVVLENLLVLLLGVIQLLL
jgi:hypothetical protein